MDALIVDAFALARRAMACADCFSPGVGIVYVEHGEAAGTGRYLGMGTQMGDLCIQWDDHAPRGAGSDWGSPQNFRPSPDREALLNLDDRLTALSLLPRVWDAHGDQTIGLSNVEKLGGAEGEREWLVRRPSTRQTWRAATPAEALVVALECAP